MRVVCAAGLQSRRVYVKKNYVFSVAVPMRPGYKFLSKISTFSTSGGIVRRWEAIMPHSRRARPARPAPGRATRDREPGVRFLNVPTATPVEAVRNVLLSGFVIGATSLQGRSHVRPLTRLDREG